MGINKLFLVILLFFFAFTAQAEILNNDPNDPYYLDTQIYNQYASPDLNIQKAWDLSTGDSSMIVAVLDSGVDIMHPDLINNIWINEDEIADNGIDDDNNGYIDDINGWDFYNDNNIVSPNEVSNKFPEYIASHGTMVAGIIGAEGNNNYGIAGVNWQVKIMPLKVTTNKGDATDVSASIKAINYARSNGANIINMSYGETKPNELEARALKRAYQSGILNIAAVGNDAGSTDEYGEYPACYPYVIAVAANIDISGDRESFSNYGPCVDISTLGFHIYSTGLYKPDAEYEYDSFTWGSGTSSSTPLVTGAAALMKARTNALGRNLPIDLWIQTLLKSTNDHVSALPAQTLGYGRLNIYRAVKNIGKVTQNDSIKIYAYTKSDKKHLLIPNKYEFHDSPYFIWNSIIPPENLTINKYYVYFGQNKNARITKGQSNRFYKLKNNLIKEGKYYLKVKAEFSDGSKSKVSTFIYKFRSY